MPRHAPAPSLATVAAIAAVAVLAAACAHAPDAGAAYVSGRCPVPDDVRGYPIVVTSENGASS
jgi:hypothetical protein